MTDYAAVQTMISIRHAPLPPPAQCTRNSTPRRDRSRILIKNINKTTPLEEPARVVNLDVRI